MKFRPPWPSWCRDGSACRLASPWCNRILWVTQGQAGFSGSQIRPYLSGTWSMASTTFLLTILSDREARWRI
jgi:hypothetical protein